MAAKEDTNTTTILIMNHTDWTSQRIPLNNHPDIHTIVTIPPHSIQYNPMSEWPKYYHYIEPSLTSTIYIHNQTTLTPNPKTAQELQNILQRLTNTHITTHHIKPTHAHYNVKFSNKWKNAPHVIIPSSLNITTTPYPPYTTTSIPLNMTRKRAYTQMDHSSHHPKTPRDKS